MKPASDELPLRLRQLFEQHSGLVTRPQALDAGLPAHWLAYYTKTGLLERSQRGIYRQPDSDGFTHENLLEVNLRIPQAVICTLSALAFHELGTNVPSAIHLAVPVKARRPKVNYPPLELYYFSPKQFAYGIQLRPVGPGQIRVYSPEKTLSDTLRLTHRIERSVFLEALKAYLARPGRDLNTLFEAARVCRVEQRMRLLVETVLA
jgi:predicted transcriptional regulator of viral defense system